MPADEVLNMISEALRAVAIGLPGVFLVLLAFYVILKLMMTGAKHGKDKEKGE